MRKGNTYKEITGIILCIILCVFHSGCSLHSLNLNDSDNQNDYAEVFIPMEDSHVEEPRLDDGASAQSLTSEMPLQDRPNNSDSRQYKICLDPGHFGGVNKAECIDSYNYVEGDFTLALALNLKQILESQYGVTVYLTRETDSITIDGYSDDELDSHHISLRGSYAKTYDCDFFISLHTNANLNYANGYDTYGQPIEITKVIILANIPCCESKKWLSVANQIGLSLTNTNFEIGLSTRDEFLAAEIGKVPKWTDDWNDSLIQPGAVLSRLDGDEDHYGVLRGSASVGIPGIIVEHGFHTVPYMRYLAAYENLAVIWAESDAEAIAEALGLTPQQ